MLPYLREAHERADKGAVYIVDGKFRQVAGQPAGWKNCNLRTQFGRILKRAGLTPWPRLFHNRRASRETELAHEHPMHVVTAWVGNMPKIAMKHYLQVTDKDFKKATKRTARESGARSGALALQNAVQQVIAASRTDSQETGSSRFLVGSWWY